MCIMLDKHLSGKYKLIKLLNQGPYAKVYQAKDTFTGQSVAIKAMQATAINTTKSLELEMQAMTRLNHPNIIKLVEVLANEDNDDQVYIVTEFAKCGDLFDKVAAKGRLNEDLSRHYFRDLIFAVKHCHSRGVFHRDIKPENILLDDRWRLKLSDFGLSAVSEDPDQPCEGRFWDPCGTVEYAAPEVMMVGKCGYEGAKADVWSCGVVLYVLTAGFLPFDGNVKEMWRKLMKGQIKFPKWMSPGLKWLLLRMLDSNPETRINIDEILEDGWFNQGYDQEAEQ